MAKLNRYLKSEEDECRLSLERLSEWNAFLLQRFLAAYDFVARQSEGRSLLEVGCGTGYGARYVAGWARQIVAIDYSLKALREGRAGCDRRNVFFVQADATEPILRPDSVDLAFSLQVIEHIDPVLLPGYISAMQEASRGPCIFSAANKKLRHPTMFPSAHYQEFDTVSLRALLNPFFHRVELLGLHGTSEIAQMEAIRLKLSPVDYLIHYMRKLDVFNLRLLISRQLRNRWLSAMNSLGDRVKALRYALPPDFEQHTMHDYFISGDGLDTCLDIIAVCHKNG